MVLGRGTSVAKFDLRVAYRNVPVHPDGWWIVEMQWEGNVYVGSQFSHLGCILPQ